MYSVTAGRVKILGLPCRNLGAHDSLWLSSLCQWLSISGINLHFILSLDRVSMVLRASLVLPGLVPHPRTLVALRTD